MLQKGRGTVHVKPALAAVRDGKVLENLGLQRCAEPLDLPYLILFRGRLEFGERSLYSRSTFSGRRPGTVSISSTPAGIPPGASRASDDCRSGAAW